MASKGMKMCQSCRALIPANAVRCEMCGAEGHYAARQMDDEAALGLFAAWPVTALLLTLNIVVYGLTLLYQQRLFSQLDQPLGFSLTPIGLVNDGFGTSHSGLWQNGEAWRLVASCFLHGGPFHLLMNSLAIMQAGRLAEEVFGRAQYICLYLLSGVGGNLLAVWYGTRVVGASGALFGLIAALAVYGYRRRDAFGQGLRQNMVYWLLYGLAISFFPGVSMTAHVGGLLVGGALAFILLDSDELRRSLLRVRLAQSLAVLAWLVIAGTGTLMARNVLRQNQTLLIQLSAERVYTVWLNQLRLNRLLAGVALKQAGGDANHQQLPAWPDLASAVDKTYKELCSDAGSLGRLTATDEKSAQLYQQMSANLRARCDQPLSPPKADEPASFTAYQQQNAQGQELEKLLKEYELWLEQKAVSLRLPANKLKPRLVNQAGEEVEISTTGNE